MNLLVGCPLWRRAWALPRWFAHVEHACHSVHVEPSYVFAVDPRDQPTFDIIEEFCQNNNRRLHTVFIEEGVRADDKREWNEHRYHRMVYLRNALLSAVRKLDPYLYLSLDSDIFLHPLALATMGESIERFDAVGSKCFMTPTGTWAPSYAMITAGGGLHREDSDGVMVVDAIMAIKLMRPTAYHIDYEFHMQGEDIGWSLACQRAKLRLGWDGRVVNKHCMTPDQAEAEDTRCGF